MLLARERTKARFQGRHIVGALLALKERVSCHP
jgi:hypothetical protein